MAELEINQTQNIVTLEQAILEGGDALIPFEFEYPNTDLIVEVKLKPLILNDLPAMGNVSEEELAGILVEKAMYNVDGSTINPELIKKIPIGTVKKISDRVTEISGFDIDELKAGQLKRFP